MDLQEWELLPDDGFLEIHDDGGKKFFSRKFGGDYPRENHICNTNYFICPSPKSPNPPKNQLPEIMTSTEKPIPDDDELVIKEVITKVTSSIDQEEATKAIIDDIIIGGGKSDTVSQVFFKKMEENEFVDMKMDSPRSRVVVPQIDAGKFQFEDTSDQAYKGSDEEEKKIVEKESNINGGNKGEEAVNGWEDKEGGLNLWKWSLTGIGAICSFGVAAATICIIISGTHHKNKQQQNQKLRFQIYADEKRMKEVVHQATKLNEAISSAVRGAPLTGGARITIGGYYDGL